MEKRPTTNIRHHVVTNDKRSRYKKPDETLENVVDDEMAIERANQKSSLPIRATVWN